MVFLTADIVQNEAGNSSEITQLVSPRLNMNSSSLAPEPIILNALFYWNPGKETGLHTNGSNRIRERESWGDKEEGGTYPGQ